ncbi:MAG: hypothetical protein ACE5IZ_08795, partial [Dehalococcoidia bacterium]
IAHLTFIATVHLSYQGGRLLRRMKDVAFVSAGGGDGVELTPLSTWDPDADSFRVLESGEAMARLARWAGLDGAAFTDELGRRQTVLEGLVKSGVTAIPQVHEAIASYYQRSGEGSPKPSKG